MTRLLRLAAGLAPLLALASCGDPLEAPRLATIALDPAADTIYVDEQAHFRPDVRASDGEAIHWAQLEWRSLGPAIASVDTLGRARGRGRGTTAIIARTAGVRGAARLTVLSLDFAQVSAGRLFTCALTRDRLAYCWGFNSYGQLGHPGGSIDCGGSPCERVPARVETDTRFVSISAGWEHACALDGAGNAYCWGKNAYGELGRGSAADRPCLYDDFSGCDWRPARVAGARTFRSIAAGANHTCALTSAGEAYCWGLLDERVVETPTRMGAGLAFASISAGKYHTCGIATDGAAYCWGYNADGQLGIGTSDHKAAPTRVAGGRTFALVSAGERHSCGLTRAGHAYCWGADEAGELGTGTGEPSLVPVAVETGLAFDDIAAAFGPHTCAVAVGGFAYCWGADHHRQLGRGDQGPGSSLAPVLVAGNVRFASLDAGWVHNCGMGQDGVLRCWGYNGAGETGRLRTDSCPFDGSLRCGAEPLGVYGGRN